MTVVLGSMEVVALLLGAVVTFALLETIIRRTLVGTGLVLLAAGLVMTFPLVPGLWLGSTRFDVLDLVSILLLAAAVARLLRVRQISGLQWLLIAFGVVAVGSAAQGMVEFGVNAAANDFRAYFWFVSIALYFSTVEPESLLNRIARTWLAFAGFLVFLALLRWVPLPSGLFAGAFDADGFRVLPAAATLVLWQGFVIGAIAWTRGEASTWIRRLTPILLAAVVLLQHRTVWAVLLITVVVAFLFERRATMKLLPVAALSLVTIAVFSLAVFDDEATEIPTQLAETATFRGTWEWRVEGWQALIEQGPSDPAEVLIGQPFGRGFERLIRGHRVTVSPHNFYLQTYLRTGVLGIGLLAALYVTVLWRLARSTAGHGLLAHRTLFLVVMAHPIYFISYGFPPEQGLLLGMAIGAALVGRADPSKTPLRALRDPA